MSQPSDAHQGEDLDVGLSVVRAFLAARGYAVVVELRTGHPTVTFRLEPDGQRSTLLAQRETLLQVDLEELLVAPALADRLQEEAVTVLEGADGGRP